MKKLLVISLLVINLPAFGLITNNVPDGCGTVGASQRAVWEPSQYNCSSGTYLPADGIACTQCPNGYTCPGGTYSYNENIPQGITPNSTALITQNVVAGCGIVNNAKRAVYEINHYTCNSGYFLPADSETCAACPSNATCTGGTFTLNETDPQGVVINFPITQNQNNLCSIHYAPKKAVFARNEYNCSAGTYLPANGIECATCPADSYCGGGTYTFNETNAQGATACDTGAHSPAGSSSASQCVMGYTCTSGQYLPKNTTVCTACPNGYTCAGGTYNLDVNNDQGIIGNTITINWNGALQSDIEANEAGTVTYGGDIRTPVRADPAQIPAGKRFVGWVFRKTNN